jgi:hypothetical protein
VTTFHLVDLISQRAAVREHLTGKSPAEILEWLATKGRLTHVAPQPSFAETYEFESSEGFRAVFFFQGGDMVFIGDHTTFV